MRKISIALALFCLTVFTYGQNISTEENLRLEKIINKRINLTLLSESQKEELKACLLTKKQELSVPNLSFDEECRIRHQGQIKFIDIVGTKLYAIELAKSNPVKLQTQANELYKHEHKKYALTDSVKLYGLCMNRAMAQMFTTCKYMYNKEEKNAQMKLVKEEFDQSMVNERITKQFINSLNKKYAQINFSDEECLQAYKLYKQELEAGTSFGEALKKKCGKYTYRRQKRGNYFKQPNKQSQKICKRA